VQNAKGSKLNRVKNEKETEVGKIAQRGANEAIGSKTKGREAAKKGRIK